MVEFHPIETAPKDGTKIIAKLSKRHSEVIAWWSGGEWKCKELAIERMRETKRRKQFVNPFQRRSPTVIFTYEPTLWATIEQGGK